jgi:hypothetical protein
MNHCKYDSRKHQRRHAAKKAFHHAIKAQPAQLTPRQRVQQSPLPEKSKCVEQQISNRSKSLPILFCVPPPIGKFGVFQALA